MRLNYERVVEPELPVRDDVGYDNHTARGFGRDDLRMLKRLLIPAATTVLVAIVLARYVVAFLTAADS